MSLLHEKWIKIVRHDGMSEKVAPYQIADQSIVDVVSPRPDFKGALVQFLIGLLQTTSAPEDMDEWKEWWEEPPSPDVLKERFETVAKAFEFDTEGAAFMQDYDLLGAAEPRAITSLIIENEGHFVKTDRSKLCPYCAATTLFTLQINAPEGGRGHLTGIRGGGPLSTLVLPDEQDEKVALWRKLWLNIFSEEDVAQFLTGNRSKNRLEDIFHWLAPTHTSENKAAIFTPEDAHPYQIYWAMPRRIRLDFSKTVAGVCDICGESGQKLLTQYRTRPSGVRYSKTWEHPLSPHYEDPKTKTLSSLHGQKGCIVYRHWLGVVLGEENKRRPALTVKNYLEEKLIKLDNFETQVARLWIFGYDMEHIKSRCWYDSTMPIYFLREDIRENFKDAAHDFINAASDVASTIRSTIKQAWFSRPGDAKGDFSFIDTAFWQNTEQNFYEELKEIIKCLENKKDQSEVRKRWAKALKSKAVSLFDQWALAGPVQDIDMDMERIMEARRELLKWISIGKTMKALLTKGEKYD